LTTESGHSMKLFQRFVMSFVIFACGAAGAIVQQQPQVSTGIASSNQPAAKTQTPSQKKTAKKVASATKPTPTPAPTPVPSPTPMQAMKPSDMPPAPPQVTFKNGLLTVNAVNSTLSSLLTAIRNKTGIEFEGAELAGQDRVAISIGPASEGEVLASILSGSSLDYVVMGRPDSPTIVQRVMLSRRSRAPGAPVVANGQPAPNPNGQQEADEEGADDNGIDPDQPQDTAIQPPPVQQQPEGQAQQPPATDPSQQPAQPKTPEQLLQELKEMQQKQSGQTPDPNSAPRKLPPQPR
jgi:hypothetical protein